MNDALLLTNIKLCKLHPKHVNAYNRQQYALLEKPQSHTKSKCIYSSDEAVHKFVHTLLHRSCMSSASI